MKKHSLPQTDELRVLFAVFQTSNRANGGVESLTQVIELGKWQGVVVTQKETPTNERWCKAGLDVEVWSLPYQVGSSFFRTSLWKKFAWMFSLIRTNLKTWRVAKQHKINVVHCNDPAPFWHIAIGAFLAGIPVVWNLRDTKPSLEALPRKRYRNKLRWCRALLVLSREMADYYREAVGEQFLKHRDIALVPIYSIVDLEKMKPLESSQRQVTRRSLGIQDTEFAIGYAAAFNDKKNQLQFIRNAGAELQKSIPNARVHLLGDFRPAEDAYAKRCLEAVKETGTADLFAFHGFTEDMSQWYAALDAVIVPTRQEGLARCMIEAMACGVPVVSFDVCSAREMLDEYQCGSVLEQGDYEGLVAKLVELSKNPALRSEQGDRGSQAAAKLFSATEVIAQYKHLYSRLS
jgi:glycosyltransferase involved in cell wall biosynthesis